jgi:hypothetical protein
MKYLKLKATTKELYSLKYLLEDLGYTHKTDFTLGFYRKEPIIVFSNAAMTKDTSVKSFIYAFC